LVWPGTAGVLVCRPVRQTGGWAPHEGTKGTVKVLPSQGSMRCLPFKETAFGLGCGGLASNGENLDMILFPQCARVKKNRTILLWQKEQRNTHTTNANVAIATAIAT
jgi:hypothetical protein